MEHALSTDLTPSEYLERLVAEALGVASAGVGRLGESDVMAIYPELNHALGLVAVDDIDFSTTRMKPLKKFLARIVRPQMHKQAALNRSLTTIAALLTNEIALARATHDRLRSETAAAVADVRVAVELLRSHASAPSQELERAVVALGRRLESNQLTTSQRVDDLVRSMATVSADVERTIDLVSARDRLIEAGSSGSEQLAAALLRAEQAYQRFEVSFRGDEAAIRERLAPYLDDLHDQIADDGLVIDVGCGRGEWLGLLADRGVRAVGIDSNREVVRVGRLAGHDMRHGDALQILGQFGEGSAAALTTFHVVEHMRVPEMLTLLDEAFRVLQPGGRLIVETPNPTNVLVGAAAFYRDPTHLRPVHPDLLGFIAREAGFTDVEVRFLHPAEEAPLPDGADPAEDSFRQDLHWAIRGPQDYAILATKPAAV